MRRRCQRRRGTPAGGVRVGGRISRLRPSSAPRLAPDRRHAHSRSLNWSGRTVCGPRATVRVMSEYQYYEFAAVDRPLDSRELAQVRALSTRAQITSTSFVNTYHWGDFRGSPRAMVERYYDAFLYVANWGTRQL